MTAMNPTIAPPERRRGRLQLLLLVAVVVGPMVLATLMYRFDFWVPEARSYHGTLVAGETGLQALGVDRPSDRWQLLVTAPHACADACQRLVYLARQVNIGLGREADRVVHALAVAAPVDGDYASTLQREYPQLLQQPLDAERHRQSGTPDAPHLWIVDPHGNPVLRYPAGTPGKGVLEDLKHLLKISRIG
ncbi:hypothetical protein [Stutzerimonas urumqiensis]|uniref:hypothetical protein n=1 Tax=Stutzerimonas urumqiensis TaxID=638269 RepID=UPI000EB307B8|nr:hypothetical protein [Stutzerimonas urumqiensis]